MKANVRRPRWILLGLALLLFLGLLAIEHGLAISAAEHRLVLVAVVLLFYALVALWLKANSAAIMMEDWGGTILDPGDPDSGPDRPDRPETDNSDHPWVAGLGQWERVAPPEPTIPGTHPAFTESPPPVSQARAEEPLPPQPAS